MPEMPAIQHADEPSPGGKPGGLGEKLRNAILSASVTTFNRVAIPLANAIRNGLLDVLETLEKPLVATAGPLLDDVLALPGLPPSVRSVIQRTREGRDQVAVGGLLIAIGSLILMLVPAALSGVQAKVQQISYFITRPTLLDFATWYRASLRNTLYQKTMTTDLQGMGWRDDQIAAAKLAAEQRLGIADIAVAMHRGNISRDEAFVRLRQLGIPEFDAQTLIKSFEPIPQAGDLIRMAVREAWNDQVARRYGYDEDYPAEFGEWMGKQGYNPAWPRRWWRAHWEVPGPTMARDMLWRTDMTEDDYATLLKVADYPPLYRKWMIETAYQPYTRVDVRRMYQVGVIRTYAELVKAHTDIGYDLEKAQKLADFTILEYGESEKEATRSEVISAYQLGRISNGDARSFLAEMGYPDWIVDMYLAKADLSRSNGLASEQIGHAKTMYVNGQMSATDVYSALARVNLPAAEVERYLEEWEISRTAKIARPSRTDLLRFFLQNEMSEAEYRNELAGFRLSARYIDWYAADALRKLVLQAQDEMEKAQKEAETVRTRAERTTYDIQAADIAVQIAEFNLKIADLKASSTPEMTLEDIAEISDLVVSCQLQIKTLQLKKAQLWSEYLKGKEV